MHGIVYARGHGCKVTCYEAVAPKPIHKKLKYRTTTRQGVYEIAREPSQYGWVKKPVYARRDAVYRIETVRVKLPARYVWKRRWVNGRYVKCKIRKPACVVVRERRVLVSPAGYVRTGAYTRKRILLKPYKNLVIYHKARHHYVHRRVTIWPEGVRWRRISK
jgi:hypothetical protein